VQFNKCVIILSRKLENGRTVDLYQLIGVRRRVYSGSFFVSSGRAAVCRRTGYPDGGAVAPRDDGGRTTPRGRGGGDAVSAAGTRLARVCVCVCVCERVSAPGECVHGRASTALPYVIDVRDIGLQLQHSAPQQL